MADSSLSPDSAALAIKILKAQLELTTASFATENRQQLIFHILNNTVKLLPYKRASIWDMSGNSPVLLGISGQTDINKVAPLAVAWAELIKNIKNPSESVIIDKDSFTGDNSAWKKCAAAEKYSAAWVPLLINGHIAAGIWLERWEETAWNKVDLDILNNIAKSYSVAWKKRTTLRTEWKKKALQLYKDKRIRWVGIFILYIVFLHPFRLRVVAPCEVIPEKPEIICAPIDSVIKEITVSPGQKVKRGDLLVLFDDKVIMEQLNVVRQQVEITRAKLERAQVEAFSNDEAKSLLQTLTHQLEQEKARLSLAERQAEFMKLRAPCNGVVMIDRVQEWRGHAIRHGDEIMLLIDQDKTIVRVMLPEADNIDFAQDVPIQVFLDYAPFSTLQGKISYISHYAKPNENGVSCFTLEAEWADNKSTAKPGLKGRAILYGNRVNLFYLIMRKPLSGIRRFLGI